MKPERIQFGLRTLSAWTLTEQGEIARTFRCQAVDEVSAFVGLVLHEARNLQREPAVEIYRDSVRANLGRGGLEEADFEIARRLDRAFADAWSEARGH